METTQILMLTFSLSLPLLGGNWMLTRRQIMGWRFRWRFWWRLDSVQSRFRVLVWKYFSWTCIWIRFNKDLFPISYQEKEGEELQKSYKLSIFIALNAALVHYRRWAVGGIQMITKARLQCNTLVMTRQSLIELFRPDISTSILNQEHVFKK